MLPVTIITVTVTCWCCL